MRTRDKSVDDPCLPQERCHHRSDVLTTAFTRSRYTPWPSVLLDWLVQELWAIEEDEEEPMNHASDAFLSFIR
jgi:hypothetical protein